MFCETRSCYKNQQIPWRSNFESKSTFQACLQFKCHKCLQAESKLRNQTLVWGQHHSWDHVDIPLSSGNLQTHYLLSAMTCQWDVCWSTSLIRNWQITVLPPSVHVQIGRQPSWKICLRIQLSIGFWSRAVKACGNFPQKLAWLSRTIFWKFCWALWICLPGSSKWRYRQNYDVNEWQVWIWEAFLGRISAPSGAMDGWHWHIVGKTYAKLTILCHHAKKLIYHFTN